MDCLKHPAFMVGEIEEDLNLSLPPCSGEEYIKRVVMEAQQCDDVVVAKIDEKKLKKQTINVKTLAGCTQAPSILAPTLEWQNCQVADFSDLRMQISRIRDDPRLIESKVDLPDSYEKDEWIKLCSAPNEKSDDECNRLPLLSIVLSMKQPVVEQVLEYLVESLESKENLEELFGQWLYALLVVLEVPLNPDACSCLRRLARICSEIRAKKSESDEREVTSLNLIICLVARYFRQLDLADS